MQSRGTVFQSDGRIVCKIPTGWYTPHGSIADILGAMKIKRNKLIPMLTKSGKINEMGKWFNKFFVSFSITISVHATSYCE
jgi:hypothetical protein